MSCIELTRSVVLCCGCALYIHSRGLVYAYCTSRRFYVWKDEKLLLLKINVYYLIHIVEVYHVGHGEIGLGNGGWYNWVCYTFEEALSKLGNFVEGKL